MFLRQTPLAALSVWLMAPIVLTLQLGSKIYNWIYPIHPSPALAAALSTSVRCDKSAQFVMCGIFHLLSRYCHQQPRPYVFGNGICCLPGDLPMGCGSESLTSYTLTSLSLHMMHFRYFLLINLVVRFVSHIAFHNLPINIGFWPGSF